MMQRGLTAPSHLFTDQLYRGYRPKPDTGKIKVYVIMNNFDHLDRYTITSSTRLSDWDD